MIVEEGDIVMVHGRYIGWAEKHSSRSTSFACETEKARRALGRKCRKRFRPRRRLAATQCSPFLGEQQDRRGECRIFDPNKRKATQCNSR